MTEIVEETPGVGRRNLLRGGGLLAGAAGVGLVGAALHPGRAEAADGSQLLVGRDNEGTSSTTLTIAPSPTKATLELANPSGPALRLSPLAKDFEGQLKPGDVVSTNFGALIGVNYGTGPEVDILVTGADLDLLPAAVAVDPQRLLDTRSPAGRSGIVRSSSKSALTAQGKLRAGQWIDVAVGTAGEPVGPSAVFVNATVVAPEKNGYLSVYPPTTATPTTSTLNYRAGDTIANGAFVGVGVYQKNNVVRLKTLQTTHLLLDLTGAVVGAVTPPASDNRANTVSGRRLQRQANHVARIRKSLESR